MGSAALQKLEFVIGMIDKTSGPAARITNTIKKMTDVTRKGISNIGYGAAGIFGAAQSIEALVEPAREFNRAVGEVRSLGVANDVLDDLQKTALRFSIQYGESAADFVRSSYDIQSAIASLRGNELAKFTEAGGILAKATKSDMGTITNYMGTMYGVFQTTADRMGKSAWVQQMTGQTALAVQMFKTTGPKMADAFGQLGASATSAGIDAAEQIAVLGQLQSTMGGGEAASRYRAFLRGVANAQGELNLKFTDSKGRMLGMVAILDKLRGKFGTTIDVAEGAKLQKAFGSDEAVALINLLMQDTSGLAKNIDALGNVQGMQIARDMAATMIDPFDRLSAGILATRIALGKALMPALIPLVDRMIAGAEAVTRWTQLFPNLTKWIGIGALVIFGLIAAVSLLAVVTGACQLAWAGFTALFVLLPAVMWLAQAPFMVFFGLLKAVRIAVLLFNLALYANPLGLFVLLVIAVIAALAALWIYLDKVVAGAKLFGAAIADFVTSPLQHVIDLIKLLPAVRLLNFIREKFTATVDTAQIDKLSANVGVNPVSNGAWTLDSPINAVRLDSSPKLNVPQNGVAEQFTGAGGNVYHVTLQTQKEMGPKVMNDWLALNAP